MTIDVHKTTREHVLKACALFDSGNAAPSRQVHSLVVVVEGRIYPANFLMRLANRLADGAAKNARAAGVNSLRTMKFFSDLGFQVRKGPLQFVNPHGTRRDAADVGDNP